MTPWTGAFVRDAVGIELRTDTQASEVPVDALVGLALRRNPRRAQLLVSTVLAKHVPTSPSLAIAAAGVLGLRVGAVLDGERPDPLPGALLSAALEGDADARDARVRALRTVIPAAPGSRPGVRVIGYAETATGLGHLVAETIGARYLHSTRHVPAPGAPSIGFEEEHSHATSHVLSPVDEDWLEPDGTVVLVDDEISTGTTVINTVREMHAILPQRHWIVASLIDLRSEADRRRVDALAAELGTRIDVVALGRGSIDLPADVRERARRVIGPLDGGAVDGRAAVDGGPVDGHSAEGDSAVGSGSVSPAVAPREGSVTHVDADVAPIRSARFGVPGPIDRAVVRRIAASVDATVGTGDVLVLGSEEFIALPVRVADELGRADRSVRFSTTTRSPIAPIDRADYAIASAIRFRSHDLTVDGPGERYAYNLTRGGDRFDTIVFVPEPGLDAQALDASDGVLAALRRVTDRVVVVHTPAWHPEHQADPVPGPVVGATADDARTPRTPGDERPDDHDTAEPERITR